MLKFFHRLVILARLSTSRTFRLPTINEAVSIKELAEWFGLEVARIVVDECLAPRRN